MHNFELSPAYYLVNNPNAYKFPSNSNNNYSNNNFTSYENNYDFFPEPVITEYNPNDNNGYSSKNDFDSNNVITESIPETNNYVGDYNYDNELYGSYCSKNSDNYHFYSQNNTQKNSTDKRNNNIIYSNGNDMNIPILFNNNNINEQKYPYNSERTRKQVTPKQNMKILNNYELTTNKPKTNTTANLNQITGQVYPFNGINMKNNNTPNNNVNIKNNIISNNSNAKIINIPNNIKRDNYFDSNKNSYQNVVDNFQTQHPDKIIRNNIPNIPNNNTKVHNIKQIVPVQKNNTKDINKIKEIEEKNKIIADNIPKENIGQVTTNKTVQNDLYDINNDLPQDVIEITEDFSYLNLPPKNTFKFRPLTQDDYKNIFLKGVGIINLGNTCFINSCLQALIHCKLFILRFFDKIGQMKEDTTPISYNFLLLCIEMLDVEKRSKINYIDISYFKYIFGKKHPIFNGYAQNDSQEFCRIFLEDLSTELNEAKNKGVYRTLTNTDKKTKIDRDKEFFNNFKERENSIINDLFYSQIITSFKCQCGAEIYSFQKILDFPLLIPEKVNQIKIKDLLNIYFKSELVEFEKKCDKCQKIGKHNKEMKISRPPEILILSFQRINETTKKKNNCPVIFTEELNIYEYIDHDLGYDKECDYTLFAIVNHVGEMDVGHYFTYIKPIGGRKWCEFNDSSVRPITPQTSVFSYAYALIYIKNKYK